MVSKLLLIIFFHIYVYIFRLWILEFRLLEFYRVIEFLAFALEFFDW
jgi:hypothetical protein